MDAVTWLLSGEPWLVYNTRVEILGEDPNSPALRDVYLDLVFHEKIQSLLADLAAWPGETLKSHKKAGHTLHKLVFLADLGLRRGTPAVDALADRVLSRTAPEGPFQIMVNLPKHFGGSGEDELSWMLCDAGSTLYALAKMGWRAHPHVRKAADYLSSLAVENNGWPCAAAATLGVFRGPGKKGDPCPYANLLMVKALTLFGEDYHDQVQNGVQTLLHLWEKRRETKPYLFAMGSGFEKLKAPMVWYDILHVLNVLSAFPEARQSPALGEMAGIVYAKADDQGRYQPESIWMDWRGWDFGQKREPSRWVTFLALRALRRFQED